MTPLLSTRRAAAALAVLLVGACSNADREPFVPAPGDGPRTVVLISLDTLRPDRLGVYGNTPEVSPRLDAFADDAIVFEKAFAPAPWTLPSHMSMLTGLDPVAHGMRNDDHRLAPGIVTLAEALQEEGFRTGAFTDGGYTAGVLGFVDGFDTYEDDREKSKADNGWKRILPDATAWLEDLDDDERAFIFLHSFDAHAPFRDESPDAEVLAKFRERPVEDNPRDAMLPHLEHFTQQAKFDLHEYKRIDELLNDYDAGVHIADRGTGSILDTLRAIGRYDDALIIVTSDHGESMLEQDLHVGHGIFLSSDETHVPLMMKLPGGRHAGTRSDALVDLVDIAPTVLDVVAAPAVEDMQGQSLAALADGTQTERTALLQASGNINTFALITPEYRYHTPIFGFTANIGKRHLGAVTPPMGQWARRNGDGTIPAYDKFGDPLGLNDHFERTEELYDIDAPTATMEDLAALRPEVTATLRETFLDMLDKSIALGDALKDREGPGIPGKSTEESRAALEALGYLDAEEKDAEKNNAALEDVLPPDPRRIDRKMRESIPKAVSRHERKGHRPPDVAALQAIDRRMHELRLLIAETNDLTPQQIEQRWRAIGDDLISWAEANPDATPRAIWRLVELNSLGLSVGAKFDITPWIERGMAVHKVIHGTDEDEGGR